MNHIYTAIKERLNSHQSLFTDAGSSFIRHFDFYKNQYIYPEMHPPYKKPALFFEYSVAWKDTARGVQQGDVAIRLHLEQENYSESFTGIKRNRQVVEARDQGSALQLLTTERLLGAVLHNWADEGFTPLKRTNTDPDLNPTSTNVAIISFSTTVLDDTARQLEEAGYLKVPLDDMQTERVAKKPGAEGGGYFQV
jgi:hypothetical protein